MTIHYKVEFFTYWHCGSGLSAGADVDLLTIKDSDGFPFVPGKTVKGLIREAAESLVELNHDAYPSKREVESIFGKRTEPDDGTPKDVKEHINGTAFFSNAEFPIEDKKALALQFESGESFTHHLFTSISATAIGEDGIAKEHSLRRTEVVLPCTLTGVILHLPGDDRSYKLIEDSLSFIKRLGENRNRGLGRCCFSIIKKEEDNE